MHDIQKRNGKVVAFDAAKITAAMEKAFAAPRASATPEVLSDLTRDVVRELHEHLGERMPSVEQVQDVVELALMRRDFPDVAKAYIVYRYEHAKLREEKQHELLAAIEDRALMVRTKSGSSEPFSL